MCVYTRGVYMEVTPLPTEQSQWFAHPSSLLSRGKEEEPAFVKLLPHTPGPVVAALSGLRHLVLIITS